MLKLSCPICYNDYDTVTNVPYVKSCGHTFCSKCISLQPTCFFKCRESVTLTKNYGITDALAQVTTVDAELAAERALAAAASLRATAASQRAAALDQVADALVAKLHELAWTLGTRDVLIDFLKGENATLRHKNFQIDMRLKNFLLAQNNQENTVEIKNTTRIAVYSPITPTATPPLVNTEDNKELDSKVGNKELIVQNNEAGTSSSLNQTIKPKKYKLKRGATKKIKEFFSKK